MVNLKEQLTSGTASLRQAAASRQWKERMKLLLIGQRLNDGLMCKIGIYIILISTAVLYANPLLYMVSTSLKGIFDLFNPAVKWIPRNLEFSNYATAYSKMGYLDALFDSFLISSSAALIQVFSCALAGYAFARLYIPFKNLLFFIVLLIFIIPMETLAIPLIMLFAEFGWLGTPLPILIPALFAQGLKGSLFIIIFRQFFSTQPKELEESARIDGAGVFRTYWKIMLPLARPAMLIVFLFSFVWHWNNSLMPRLYLEGSQWHMLPSQMNQLQAYLDYLNTVPGAADLYEPIKMAGAVLIILPPLILYLFLQRYFVEGIERTGMVE